MSPEDWIMNLIKHYKVKINILYVWIFYNMITNIYLENIIMSDYFMTLYKREET